MPESNNPPDQGRQQRELDREQAIVDLEQSVADRDQAIADIDQGVVDGEQAVLDRKRPDAGDLRPDAVNLLMRQNDVDSLQARRGTHQHQLDQDQVARDERQQALGLEQREIDRPGPDPIHSEAVRSSIDEDRIDAATLRAEAAVERAKQALQRAQDLRDRARARSRR